MDREHDRMDRAARKEGAYDTWETKVLAGMRPADFPEMMWRAQWGEYKFRNDMQLAIEDAKTMAVEIGESTKVEVFHYEDGTLHFCYARPVDRCYSMRAISKETRFRFKMLLINEHRFPDIAEYAGKDAHDVRDHQRKVMERYRKMAEKGVIPEFDDIPF